jgi:hypothetical protein
MRYSLFEQAAAEANSGMKEIDAEIQRLRGKRDLLATLAQQLAAVLPALTDGAPAGGGNKAGALPDSAAAEHPHFANGAAESTVFATRQEDVPGDSSADTAPSSAGAAPETEVPATHEPSFAELLAQSKPYSLRNEGWPSSAAVDQRGLRQLI